MILIFKIKSMKKILLGLFLSASMIACTSKTETKTEIIKDNSKNQELFDRNVASFNKVIDAFVAEDPEVFASFFADSVKWCGPEKKLLTEYSTKAEMVQALKMYFSLYDNHKLDAQFYSGINYSTNKEDLTTYGDNPNNIRILGNWYHKHTASGKDVSSKWFAIIRFNSDGKIYLFNDFFDVTGLLKQHEQ